MSNDQLQIGDVVKIVNEEHVWSGEYAIIREIKPGSCRVELHGRLVWLPNNWIRNDEP